MESCSPALGNDASRREAVFQELIPSAKSRSTAYDWLRRGSVARRNGTSWQSLQFKSRVFRFVKMLISLRGPVARASRISCVAAPCPTARGAGESA
jgi:hypothetical protein